MKIFNGTVIAPTFVKLDDTIINPNYISEIVCSPSDKDMTKIYFDAYNCKTIHMPLKDVMAVLTKAGCKYLYD